jgi:hypothetical protein
MGPTLETYAMDKAKVCHSVHATEDVEMHMGDEAWVPLGKIV